MMAKGLAGFAAVLAVATLAGACSSSSSSSSSSTGPTTTKASTTTIAAGSKYVALGSSFAAGTGIPTQSPAGCGRSSQNYPNLVATKFKLTLVDVSCSGATTANVLDTPQGSSPPQIDAITPDTALVTFTVGGNDIGYSLTALACGTQSAACAPDPAKLDAGLATLKTSLTSIVSAIKAKAPKATIVLVTYPRLVPPTTCAALDFTPQGAELVGSMGASLEKVFTEVAASTNIKIADAYPLGATHGPCASEAESWMAGHTVTVGFPYHPTIAGHQEMALLTEKALNS